MAFFLVTMTHPDGDGWGRHVMPHVAYLQGLISTGKILASGPLAGLSKRAGFIIMTVETREEVDRLVAGDPFATEGLIDELTILAWDPMFGALADHASREPIVTSRT
jgi:uncharacterized protein YciI